jgi:hypothetical protein
VCFVKKVNNDISKMGKYTFVKEPSGWYIDLPEFIEQGGSRGDLQMVEGADTMLDIISEGQQRVDLIVDSEPFEESDVLELKEKCDPYIGGGYYLMREFEHKQINLTMWLCGVIQFVFNDIPHHIYVKREKINM